MKNLNELFAIGHIDLGAKREFAAQALEYDDVTQAEDALDRIFVLRLAVVEKFGEAAKYDHEFFIRPFYEPNGIAPDYKKTLFTPYEMAHRSGEGLQLALQHLRRL
jgi:hypothetical protein